MIRRILIIDEEPVLKQPQPDARPADRTLDDSVMSAASNRSPFQRVKKHVKQIITGEKDRRRMSVVTCLLMAMCAVFC